MDAIREGLRLREDYWALVRGGDEEKFRAFHRKQLALPRAPLLG
jgi:hypothetical protein